MIDINIKKTMFILRKSKQETFMKKVKMIRGIVIALFSVMVTANVFAELQRIFK